MLSFFQQLDLATLRNFSKALTAEEKELVKNYLASLKRYRNDDEERRKYNLMGMSYVEGIREGRKRVNSTKEEKTEIRW